MFGRVIRGLAARAAALWRAAGNVARSGEGLDEIHGEYALNTALATRLGKRGAEVDFGLEVAHKRPRVGRRRVVPGSSLRNHR